MTLSVFNERTCLITGGTGSFGKTLARRLLHEGNPTKVIIFSRDEWKQSEMRDEDEAFSSSKIRYFLGDIRDSARLERAFSEVDIVVHAAALKQVPAAEYNPSEFIKTNIQGAMNVVDAAIRAGVEKVIALSTDKAVNPVNLYGATKLCQEKLLSSAHYYVGSRQYPTFSLVRYGNVAGSRGSVIPFWRKLLQKGIKKLPITDPRMTRFWITLEESVDLVLLAATQGKGSEIFVPKIPSFHIEDLLKAMGNEEYEMEIVGIREGEKLHELLISQDETRNTLDFEDHYRILPDQIVHTAALLDRHLQGKKAHFVPSDFSYSSGTNPHFLSQEEIKNFLQKL